MTRILFLIDTEEDVSKDKMIKSKTSTVQVEELNCIQTRW